MRGYLWSMADGPRADSLSESDRLARQRDEGGTAAHERAAPSAAIQRPASADTRLIQAFRVSDRRNQATPLLPMGRLPKQQPRPSAALAPSQLQGYGRPYAGAAPAALPAGSLMAARGPTRTQVAILVAAAFHVVYAWYPALQAVVVPHHRVDCANMRALETTITRRPLPRASAH